MKNLSNSVRNCEKKPTCSINKKSSNPNEKQKKKTKKN